MSSHRWFAAPALAALAFTVAVAPAGAGLKTVQVQTKVKFLEVNRSTFLEFTAKIAAQKPCRDDRRGSLWYKPTEDATPEKIATDDSNRKGAFVFELDEMAIAGLYALQVRKGVEREDEAKFVCGAVKPVFYSF